MGRHIIDVSPTDRLEVRPATGRRAGHLPTGEPAHEVIRYNPKDTFRFRNREPGQDDFMRIVLLTNTAKECRRYAKWVAEGERQRLQSVPQFLRWSSDHPYEFANNYR